MGLYSGSQWLGNREEKGRLLLGGLKHAQAEWPPVGSICWGGSWELSFFFRARQFHVLFLRLQCFPSVLICDKLLAVTTEPTFPFELNMVIPVISFSFLYFFFFFCLFSTVPVTFGSSQARGRIGAAGANLRHSRSNARSEPCLWLAAQLMATPDPWPPNEARHRTCFLMDTSRVLNLLSHNRNSSCNFLKRFLVGSQNCLFTFLLFLLSFFKISS